MELSIPEQQYLLRLARSAIAARLAGAEGPATRSENSEAQRKNSSDRGERSSIRATPSAASTAGATKDQPPSQRLLEPRGAFVTLRLPDSRREEPQLRGCMGVVEATRPLTESIRDSAVSAAFRDPRFSPLSEEELEACSIEISVLSRMMPARADEIEPGRDGVLLTYGPASGLLLPQVALEQGWNREQFLDHVCLKAGVTGRCWEDSRVELFRFTASVFSEDEAFGG